MTFIRPFPAFDVAGRRLRAGAPGNVTPFPAPRPKLEEMIAVYDGGAR